MDLPTMPGIPYIGVFWMKSCGWLILRFELPYCRCGQRAHIAFYLISNFILGHSRSQRVWRFIQNVGLLLK